MASQSWIASLARSELSTAATNDNNDDGINNAERDLLALLADYPGLCVTPAMVRTDLAAAARLVEEKRACEITDVLAAIRAAQNVRVAFLVDTTGSMGSHIAGVKEQIQGICEQLTALSKRPSPDDGSVESTRVAVAFVGYKDFCSGDDRFDVFPFTSDIDAFESFLAPLTAHGGGGDGPEDVNGGLRTALDALEWDALATNVLFHIGDMPPHGSEYSSLKSSVVARRESAKCDEPIAQIFQRMDAKRIDYYFGKITTKTDKMLAVFAKARGRPVPAFDIAAPIDLAQSVLTAATLSKDTRVTAATRSSGALKRVVLAPRVPNWATLSFTDAVVVHYRDAMTIASIVTNAAAGYMTRATRVKLARAPFAEGSLRLAFYAQEFVPATAIDGSEQAHSGTRSRLRSLFGRSSRSTERCVVKDLVCKVFKATRDHNSSTAGATDLYRYLSAMETQTVASVFAKEFNARLLDVGVAPAIALHYVKSTVLAIKVRSGFARTPMSKLFMIERRLDTDAGQWIKVINNAGAVTQSSSSNNNAGTLDAAVVDALTAFAHWTYCASNGYLMVTDLQGVIVPAPPLLSRVDSDAGAGAGASTCAAPSKVVVLTDPAIHCVATTRFGRTNLGTRGMGLFFESHACNRFCHALALKVPVVSKLLGASE